MTSPLFPTVKVVERRRDLFIGRSYGARCSACGAWLSKYDETPDEARRGGEHELQRHSCKESALS